MAKIKRTFIQAVATLGSNLKISNFLTGSLYTGPLKSVCLPGLNCYSCPAAIGSCPIGAFQAVVGSHRYKISYYILGLVMVFGLAMGRLICGFLCPFGFFQDLLHKIPTRKFSTRKLKLLKYLKYFILVFIVWLGVSIMASPSQPASPYFCKYICPQGILQGAIPLAIVNSGIRASLGSLFTWKFAILVSTLVLSILYYRPFCKFICPLGAFYSLFNKVSFYQYKLDCSTCISCGKCAKTCPMDVDFTKDTGHIECIRCGKCKEVCPTESISSGFESLQPKENLRKEENI